MSGWKEEDGCLEQEHEEDQEDQEVEEEEEKRRDLVVVGDVSRSYHEGDLILEVLHPHFLLYLLSAPSLLHPPKTSFPLPLPLPLLPIFVMLYFIKSFLMR